MAVFKCKMCGGTLEITNESVAVCEYCGTKQTLPKLDDEKRANLYERANHFRRNNEFDKAAGIYEQILNEDNTDAEAYWSLVLCRYGIEYVEDPSSHKRVPTVNRAQYSSIFADKDYQAALQYADGYQSEIYESEAKAIDEIQKGILDISSKEEPFDIFICYKETDANGRRTADSVYAQEIYTALTKEGYKVFFARVTLEDKLGSFYEPYIFSALNTAKIMIVVGSTKDNFNAVWVKNEWSRFLSLIKDGKEKTFIPAYRDITPYDMPKEFQYFQAQDIGKVGAIQDIVRGIKKIIDKGILTETHTQETSAVIVDTMLKRANEALFKHEWGKAARCFDNVLDYDDKNESAYIGKLLVDFHAISLDQLANMPSKIEDNKYYKYLIENANDSLREKILQIKDSAEQGWINEKQLKKKKSKAITIKAILGALAILLVAFIITITIQRIIIPNQHYKEAVTLMNNGEYDKAISEFKNAGSYKDSELMIWETNYLRAKSFAESGDYDFAVRDLEMFGLLDVNYKDSHELKKEWTYQKGKRKIEAKSYEDASEIFEELAALDYKDSSQLFLEITYEAGNERFNRLNYTRAVMYYEKIPGYKDSSEKLLEAKYQWCVRTKDAPTDETRSYIADLVKINYKDSANLLNDINSWNVQFSDDSWFGKFSVTLQGGLIDEKTKVKAFVHAYGPNMFGYTVDFYNGFLCDDARHGAGDKINFKFDTPSIVYEGSMAEVKIYDENGNLIGEKIIEA